jgi:cytochrome c2
MYTMRLCFQQISITLVFIFHTCIILYAQKESVIFQSGKNSFRRNCSGCHSIHQEIYGPMLGSITKKRSEDWLISFIKNSRKVIGTGDTYALALFKKFNYQQMPAFEHLPESEIRAILYYIELESQQPTFFLNDAAIPLVNNSSIVQGKQAFQEHCSMCHFIHKESTFAPALGSVTKRHSRQWLIAFIQNSQKKIKAHDPYAVHLYNAFDQHVMTTMIFLEPNEIIDILNYIEFASTQNVAYAGKLNKDQYRKQAVTEIRRITNKHPVIPVTGLGLITFTLLLLLIFLYQVFFFVIHYGIFMHNKSPDPGQIRTHIIDQV